MSQIDPILGLPDLSIEDVIRAEHLEVWRKPQKCPVCVYCEHQPTRIKSTHHQILQHTLQEGQLIILNLALPTYHRHKIS